MIFKLFDRSEKYIGNLKNVLSANLTEEINGEEILEIELIDTLDIEKNYGIVFQQQNGEWKEFIITGIETTDENTPITNLFCESSLYETNHDFIEELKADNTTINIALEKALLNTRWEVGHVDNLGVNSITLNNVFSMDAIKKTIETWKGELRTRIIVSGNKIINRYIDIYDRIGEKTGQRFTFNKNLRSIKREIHRDQIITALYGFGKGEDIDEGEGKRLTFSDISWSISEGDPIDKPMGQSYVSDEQLRELWGREDNGDKKHIFAKIEFDDIEDKNQLLEKTYEKFLNIITPSVTYTGTVSALNIRARLGDSVYVIDTNLKPELRAETRIIKIKNDLIFPENSELEFGNFKTDLIDSTLQQEQFINNFRNKESVWDRAKIIDSDNRINAGYLDNLVAEMNRRMNAVGGYVYISDEGEGITTYDKPMDQNPTKAIQILGGSFRIASSKNSKGDWDWRTLGDGDGIVADAITSGELKGGKVNFDLNNGTLRIGESIENYSFLWDGTNLWMNGKINWTDGGKVVAWVSGQQLKINSMEVNEGIIGNHKFIKGIDRTTFKWAGDN